MAHVWTRLSFAVRATLAAVLAVTALAGAQVVSPTPAAADGDVCATAPTPPAANVFISCWDTTEIADGTSDASSIALPLADTDTWGGTYNFTVQWGDGSSDVITDWDQPETIHTYATPGRYWLQITGTFSDFSFDAAAVRDGPKLITVSQWGGLTLGNRGGYFHDARNMNFTATDAPDLSQTTSLNGAFQGASSFNSPINHWDVSTVNSMYGTFAQATAFNQPLSMWNTSNVTTFGMAFLDAAAFNQDLSNWNTSNVTSMFWMFFRASSFNNGGQPLTWDVSNVTMYA
ncbi:MAG: BspA family leucine-rich repeat surface protein, partial [Chloroflexi bacterium]|nr:BspA family leucine-rich repeat surface protein [Chloroflexota bacterium]